MIGQWKCYMFASNALLAAATKQEVIDYFDSRPEIVNWKTTQGIILLVTQSTMIDITSKFRVRFPNVFLIMVEVTQNTSQGWLEKETWDFINNPKPVGVANKLLGGG
jgi:hypothetical protein